MINEKSNHQGGAFNFFENLQDGRIIKHNLEQWYLYTVFL